MTARARVWLPAALAAALLVGCGGDEDESAPEASSAVPAASQGAPAAAAPARDDFTIAGTTYFLHDEPLPTEDALRKYEAECAGGASPECKRLQWQLEFALYEDLRALALLGPLDDELLRVGAAADCPQLKSFALERLFARGLRPEEHALVVAAFDDPYPLVRGIAHSLARQLPDEKWSRMLERDSGMPAHGVRGLIAGVVPDEASLGAPIYPGSTHWHFASSPEDGEFFTTPATPDEVVAFYAKRGRTALTAAELAARGEAAQSALRDPMRIASLMQQALEAGQDPQAVMSTLGAGAPALSVDWTDGIEGREGMIDPRYVVLAEQESLGAALPARVLVVVRDERMGATALIFRSLPRRPGLPDLSTPGAAEEFQRQQQVLGELEAPSD